MKNISIMSVFETFFSDGVEYKYEGYANTRLVCHRVDDPTKKIQFSAYTTVQITDEQANKVRWILNDVKQRTECRLREIEKDLELLKEQGVLDEYPQGSANG